MSKFQIEMKNGKRYVFAEIRDPEHVEKMYIRYTDIDEIDEFVHTYTNLSQHVITDSDSFIKEVLHIIDKHEFEEIYEDMENKGMFANILKGAKKTKCQMKKM